MPDEDLKQANARIGLLPVAIASRLRHVMLWLFGLFICGRASHLGIYDSNNHDGGLITFHE